MTTILSDWVERQVNVCTVDGRVFVGTLKGFDQSTNLIIADTVERVFSETEPVESIPLGLYILRGDNVATVGELDVDVDERVPLSQIRAAPLKPVGLLCVLPS